MNQNSLREFRIALNFNVITNSDYVKIGARLSVHPLTINCSLYSVTFTTSHVRLSVLIIFCNYILKTDNNILGCLFLECKQALYWG